MIAILTSYWLQTVALAAAFGLLAAKMGCGSEDKYVDTVVGLLIAFVIGSGVARTTNERRTKKTAGGDDVPQ